MLKKSKLKIKKSTAQLDRALKSISQKIRQRIKPETSPGIKVLEIEEKSIIEVIISEGGNKPYFLDGVCYKRVGTENIIISTEELERIIINKHEQEFDSKICEGASYEDIDLKAVKWFNRRYKEVPGKELQGSNIDNAHTFIYR